MNYLFKLTIDDYFEIAKMAKANGKKPGDSMADELAEYAQKKGIKPMGATELNRDELLKEYATKGKKILDIQTDKKGKQKIRMVMPKDE